MTLEFRPWPKTPRLNGASMIITEKIDGTNACVIVSPDGTEVGAQSRNRLVTPDNDNYGFARWVYGNAGALADELGPGYHYGEWWGSGIQRGYGLTNGDKRFSLFNTGRWKNTEFTVPGLGLVPVLYEGALDTDEITNVVDGLKGSSWAAAGYDRPEGVIVYIPRLDGVLKVLIENDDKPKGAVAA